jgi:anti-sigma B factor antagonist
MASPLDAAVLPDGTGARIVLTGRIDRDGDAEMTKAYGQAHELGHGEIVLDFTGTDYINSTGIALIVRLLAQARRDGRPVRAHGLTEHYREIFRITRLSDFIALDGEEPTPATPKLGGTR